MPTLHANGLELAYEVAGDARDPAMLLLMGLGFQLSSWPQAIVDGLVESGFYVIRMDNRDAGLSTKLNHLRAPNMVMGWLKQRLGLRVKAPYTLEDMAEDARGLLDVLNIRQAHVVGVSMGGMIGQALAARHPKRVLSLVSIMSSTGATDLPGPQGRARRAMFDRPDDPGDPDSVAEHVLRVMKVVGSPSYPTPDEVALVRFRIDARRSGYQPAGILRQLGAIMASGDRRAALRTITCPTMVIHGTHDLLVPLVCGEDTARCIPGARLEIIPGMGHDLPPALNERLVALISQHAHGKMLASIPKLFENQ